MRHWPCRRRKMRHIFWAFEEGGVGLQKTMLRHALCGYDVLVCPPQLGTVRAVERSNALRHWPREHDVRVEGHSPREPRFADAPQYAARRSWGRKSDSCISATGLGTARSNGPASIGSAARLPQPQQRLPLGLRLQLGGQHQLWRRCRQVEARRGAHSPLRAGLPKDLRQLAGQRSVLDAWERCAEKLASLPPREPSLVQLTGMREPVAARGCHRNDDACAKNLSKQPWSMDTYNPYKDWA